MENLEIWGVSFHIVRLKASLMVADPIVGKNVV